MTAKPAMGREDDAQKELDTAQRQLLLALSEATTKKLVDGLAAKVNHSNAQMLGEIRELKIVLMGSELDKHAGVIPTLKSRMSRAEKAIIGLIIGLLAVLAGSPKLLELAGKMLAIVR